MGHRGSRGIEKEQIGYYLTEAPLEFRFYPNKTVNGEGFVSTGVLGIKIASKTMIKYKLGGANLKGLMLILVYLI